MSISNVLHFSPAGRNHGFHGAALPSLTASQERQVIFAAMAVFMAACSAVTLYALSALAQ